MPKPNRKLRRLRELRLGTLTEAAREMRISRSHLAYIETGKRRPSPEALRRIARGLDVSRKTVLCLLEIES